MTQPTDQPQPLTPSTSQESDPLHLQSELNELMKKQSRLEQERQAAGPDADLSKYELSEFELKRAIEIVRILRRTNTGPAKAKTTRAKKTALSGEALLNSILE